MPEDVSETVARETARRHMLERGHSEADARHFADRHWEAFLPEVAGALGLHPEDVPDFTPDEIAAGHGEPDPE